MREARNDFCADMFCESFLMVSCPHSHRCAERNAGTGSFFSFNIQWYLDVLPMSPFPHWRPFQNDFLVRVDWVFQVEHPPLEFIFVLRATEQKKNEKERERRGGCSAPAERASPDDIWAILLAHCQERELGPKIAGKKVRAHSPIDVWREAVASPRPSAEACNPAKNGEARGVPVRYSRTLTTWGGKCQHASVSSFFSDLFVFN
ncbi:hypothetical protein NPIL_58431 [Nephila pilipes]|uniref:Uncharacterized protein n=1 Tax=Nephila pilipes TaxID=299642 RepID=A0A8X6NM56_NEPPI|nr:hypothetical protein NPIL_58431 [Nephila pilipes]